jgi:hypothetical protein
MLLATNTTQTQGGIMQHPHEVDIVKAVLGAQKIVVYGEDLLRHGPVRTKLLPAAM